jgi:hypothetical protein
MPRPRHSGLVAPPQIPANSVPATGSSRPALKIVRPASATQSSMPSPKLSRRSSASAISSANPPPKISSCIALSARTSGSLVTQRSSTPSGNGASTARRAVASPILIDSGSPATNPFFASASCSPGAWSCPRDFHSTRLIPGCSR